MATQSVPKVILNDGLQIPALGFGTSGVQLADQKNEAEAAYQAIRCAINCGYRFFDTAALYMNESSVGRAINDAIKEGQVTRDELVVCTKVWNTAHKRESVMRACRDSLARLQLDYVDIYLIHWPMAYAEISQQPLDFDTINPKDASTNKLLYSDTHFLETWLGMEDTKEAGLVRSIGLSNFNHLMIDQILAMPGLRFKPSLLQVELHPYLSQAKLHKYCTSHGIILNAYCPLGAPGAEWTANQPKVIEDALIKEIAQRHQRSPAQIILRYHIERSIVPIPKSSTPARIRENFDVFDFSLSPTEMQQLLALDRGLRYCLNTAGEYPTDHPLYPFHAEY
uniref:Aldo-keto reductase family 1 member B10 n=1 Tax=Aceria tosichella TaxID=561515 RepID=A0A6G1SG48_9ACAR